MKWNKFISINPLLNWYILIYPEKMELISIITVFQTIFSNINKKHETKNINNFTKIIFTSNFIMWKIQFSYKLQSLQIFFLPPTNANNSKM